MDHAPVNDIAHEAALSNDSRATANQRPDQVPRVPPFVSLKSPRVLGQFAGLIKVGPDFDDPLPEEILAAFEGRVP